MSSKATATSASERPLAAPTVRSLGILGGTFNPPHLGHLAVARHAREQLGLDHVVLMPTGSPLHKPAAEDPGAEHRLRMCTLAVEGIERCSVCASETERGGPSYTVDTLRAIHASHPKAELTFIVGADTAATLPSWREPIELLGLARLAIASRGGSERDAVLGAVAGLTGTDASARDGLVEGVQFLTMDMIDISSSSVRERAARAEPLEEFVGATVAEYIAAHRLYRGAKVVGG